MSRAHLNGFIKRLIQRAVINRNHVTTLQVHSDLVDRLECGLIEQRTINRPLYEYEFVAVEIDQFLTSITDEAHRHCVQKFVGIMDAGEWGRGRPPLNLVAKHFECPALSRLQDWKWLQYPVAQRFEEFREAVLHKLESIPRKLSVVRPLFDNEEIICSAEALPDFEKLRGHQFPK